MRIRTGPEGLENSFKDVPVHHFIMNIYSVLLNSKLNLIFEFFKEKLLKLFLNNFQSRARANFLASRQRNRTSGKRKNSKIIQRRV